MNAWIISSAILFILALTAYPPGLSPFYIEAQDTVTVKVPPSLRAAGYPETILVARRYIQNHYAGSYELFVNRTFRPDGIFDAERHRVISPGEAEKAVLGSRIETNWVKIALALSAFILLVAGASQGLAGGRPRGKPVGGYVP